MLGRRHRLDDIAVVARMVVAVVADETAVVRRYDVKNPLASGSSVKRPSLGLHRAEALEELLPVVELKRPGCSFS